MIKKKLLIISLLTVIIILMAACDKIMPKAPADDELLDGPVEGLTNAQSLQFLNGDIAFNDEVFTKETGLGPLFVATSCGSCHAGDGKGHPFTTLTRFGQTDSSGNTFLHLGGPLLQNRALPGFMPEHLPVGATSTRLTAPIVTGLGFLSLISDADIIAMADPTDADGDGISGVPNWTTIPSYIKPNSNAVVQNGKYISRFGKKAAIYNLLQQSVTAYNQDIGITSIFNPLDSWSLKNIEPEVSTNKLNDVVFYLETLKAPIQRNQNDPDIQAGKFIFMQIGCSSCHKPNLKTAFSNIESLSNKEFHPYTDLLLHDMGTGLDDGYTEGSAKTYEWRTPPLWGLGLAPQSQGGGYFLLHDGRAKSIDEAISFHGGEAGSKRNNYYNLSESDKQKLLKFLESL
ncbi:MAG: di-heme oxidoredictase family protein [Bacteroidia bacterium]